MSLESEKPNKNKEMEVDYKKGDRIIHEDKNYYYVDDFFDDEIQERVLVCGGDGPHFTHILESEAEIEDATDQEKMLDILVDVATTLKCLSQDVGMALDILNPEMCDDCKAQEEMDDEDKEDTDKGLN